MIRRMPIKADSFNDYSQYIAAGKRRQRLCLPASMQYTSYINPVPPRFDNR